MFSQLSMCFASVLFLAGEPAEDDRSFELLSFFGSQAFKLDTET